MNGASGVVRDERTEAVENASFRLACGFMSYALLLDVMYRSLVRAEASWDLLAIVIVGGAISTFYQGKHRILTGPLVKVMWLTFLTAGIVGAVVAALATSIK